MNKDLLVAEFSKFRPSSTFVSLNEYVNSSGEVSNYNLVFHVSYASLLERSIAELGVYIPDDEVESKAKDELISSYEDSLKKLETKTLEELEENYLHFRDSSGNYIKGIKLHKDSDTLHLYGTVLNKKVIVPGNYKEVKSKPLTLAKNKLAKSLPVSKWRQFKICTGQVKSIKVENISISIT